MTIFSWNCFFYCPVQIVIAQYLEKYTPVLVQFTMIKEFLFLKKGLNYQISLAVIDRIELGIDTPKQKD